MSETARARAAFRDLLVIGGGLVSTALTLIAVFWLAAEDSDFEIMGWYAMFVIPAGAILVGIAAGSGYGLTSWLSGRKVGGGLLVAVVVLLVLAYGAAQWIEFKSFGLVYEDGAPVSFFDYYDSVTRSMQFSAQRSSEPSGELGLLGYLFRVLELAGFAGGGLLVPVLLRAKPYCEGCGIYMRSRSIGWIPAAVPHRKIKKKDTAGQEVFTQEMEEAFEAGTAAANSVMQAAQAGDPAAARGVLDPLAAERKSTAKLLHRYELVLSKCPACQEGFVRCKLHSGQGQEVQTRTVAEQAVGADFSRAVA